MKEENVMKTHDKIFSLALSVLLCALSGCGGGGGSGSSSAGTDPISTSTSVSDSNSNSTSSESYDTCNLPSNPNPVFSVFPVDWDRVEEFTGFGTHGTPGSNTGHVEGSTKIYPYIKFDDSKSVSLGVDVSAGATTVVVATTNTGFTDPDNAGEKKAIIDKGGASAEMITYVDILQNTPAGQSTLVLKSGTSLFMSHDASQKIREQQPGVTLYSPADGYVKAIKGREDDYALTLCHSGEVRVQFGHMGTVSVKEGDTVKAGQVIGTTGAEQPGKFAFDYNVFNKSKNNGFPSSWPPEYNTADCPVNYFSEAGKSQFLTLWNAQVSQTVEDTCELVYCGQLNMNEDYKLNGVWFPKEGNGFLSFIKCPATTGTYAGKLVSGGYAIDMSKNDTDLGNGEHCLQMGDYPEYMRYKFLSASEIQVEKQNDCPSSFTSNARVYSREYVEIHKGH